MPAAPGLHTPSKGSLTIAKVKTDGGKGPTFEISVGDCKVPKGQTAGECNVYVSLHGHREKLPWTSVTGSVFQQGDKSVAIGDEADTALAVSWSTVKIAKGINGVIVTEQSGGERVKHRHDVFLDVKNSMLYALSAGPARGENTWSNITTLDVDGNGTDELIMVHASRPDAEAEADQWDIGVYGWRADISKIVKLPSWSPTIHAAMVGSFNNVKDARELAANKCLREFIVVDSKSAPLLADNSFAVVYPAATQRDADLALEAAKACDDDLVGAVKIIARGMDVKEPE
ncbi:MAG TPA: hypothetical protein VGO62_01155 [Myxococcota bacterium]